MKDRQTKMIDGYSPSFGSEVSFFVRVREKSDLVIGVNERGNDRSQIGRDTTTPPIGIRRFSCYESDVQFSSFSPSRSGRRTGAKDYDALNALNLSGLADSFLSMLFLRALNITCPANS